ncbi:MAG: hypothetical protein ACI3YL_03785 [Prevotella sp.]|nr:hypothetical protein [Prevotella sp.]MCI5853984.1 hypothetical protein [Prevotella sp.]MDD6736715.1 hypothetical protein [Prevotella sp.]MDY6092100.1 hypothetical protein [Prevotella sp.]
MRTIKLACFVAALMISAVAFAQNSEEAKKTINSIKKNSQYIYAEATAATQQDAKDLAEEILYEEINSYVASKKKMRINPKIVINNRKELVSSLALPRGNMFRSFIYVKKSDVLAVENSEMIGNKTSNGETAAATTTPVVSTVTPVYADEVKQVMACSTFDEVKNLMTKLKSEGKIRHFGGYASLEDPDPYYLAIYNRQYQIVAVLTPGPNRTNTKTGEEDKVTNYKGCGAVGFVLK